MKLYQIGQTLVPLTGEEAPTGHWAAILSTDELEGGTLPVWLDRTHLISGTLAYFCRAEVRQSYLWGTFSIPDRVHARTRTGLCCTLTADRIIFVDDSGLVQSCLEGIVRDRHWKQGSVGRLLHDFLDALIGEDLRYLEELEDRVEALENGVLSGDLETFNPKLLALRKLISARFRYYTQLDDVASLLQDNEAGFFSQEERQLFRLFSDRVGRLRGETQMLREFCLQVHEMFQAEIDIRQNKVMKILTVVTTVFMPLSLLVGWYGMNFYNMPEVAWKYGYPAVAAASALIVTASLWLCKKKKFW